MTSVPWHVRNPELAKIKNRERYLANRDARLAYAAQRRESQRESDRQYQAEYRRANPERIRAKNANQYRKNRETRLLQRSKYYAENRERIAQERRAETLRRKALRDERDRAYREQYADRIAADEAAKVENSRIRNRLRASRRRARERNNPSYSLTEKDLRRLLVKPCAVIGCGESTNMHVDHIVPVCRGGSHGIGNLQMLCAAHNTSKGAKTWMEFRVYLRSG